MKLYLEIVGDTNDADYIRQRTEVTESELALISDIVSKIKKKPHNWGASEYAVEPVDEQYKNILTKEQIELMQEYIPCGEHCIHTIVSIKVLKVVEEISLL